MPDVGRRRRPRARTVVVAAVVVTVGAAATARAATSGSQPRYRLASVTRGSTAQTLVGVGTVQPAHQASVSFPVTGTVATVPVHLGQEVKAGQVLATLDPTALQAALDSATAQRASAQLTLDSARNGQLGAASTGAGSSGPAGSSGSSGSSGAAGSGARTSLSGSGTGSSTSSAGKPSASPAASGSGSGSGPGKGSGSGSKGSTSGNGSIAAAQQQLLADQRAADAALAGVRTALRQADLACGVTPPPETNPKPTTAPKPTTSAGPGTSPKPSTSPKPTVKPTAPPTPTATPTAAPTEAATPSTAGDPAPGGDVRPADYHPSGSTATPSRSPAGPGTGPSTGPSGAGEGGGSDADPAACLKAGTAVLQHETAAQQSLQTVAQDEAALNALLRTATGTASGSGSGLGSGSGSSSSRSSLSGTASRSSGSTVVSAEQLAAYQAAVDADDAAIEVARQNLTQATIVSPISGTVHAVGLAVGDRVSASSSTATVLVSGPGDEQAVVPVSVTQLPTVKLGQEAVVTPDGSTRQLTGTVTRIGLLPVSGSTTTYPVTVTLPGTTAIPDGSTAQVSLKVGASAATAVVVPTSALTQTGRRYTVRVVSDAAVTTVPVEVGAVGPQFTEVTNGLTVGQQVIVAELDTPLPTGNTTPRLGGAGIGGGLGGGIVGGGGIGGGGGLGGAPGGGTRPGR